MDRTEAEIAQMQYWDEAKKNLLLIRRDQFAMAALQAIITHDGVDHNIKDKHTSSAWAYEYADAMLEAREEE